VSSPRVYIETTIPSFYHEIRTDPESAARKNWTQHWWDFKRGQYELFTSAAVYDELRQGDFGARDKALSLLTHIPLLPTTPAIFEIIATYIRHYLMPADPAGDALHLALASYYDCDFLLTWNCAHLANAKKFPHIRRINAMLGLCVPSLVTPLELLEEDPLI
jgi:hypothetical protein